MIKVRLGLIDGRDDSSHSREKRGTKSKMLRPPKLLEVPRIRGRIRMLEALGEVYKKIAPD